MRIKHIASGVTATGCDQKSLQQNKKSALTRLINKREFKDWLKVETSMFSHKIDKSIEEMMRPENLRIEYL